jgi:hypothetical protein
MHQDIHATAEELYMRGVAMTRIPASGRGRDMNNDGRYCLSWIRQYTVSFDILVVDPSLIQDWLIDNAIRKST